jgi:hypothetical protein
MSRGPGMTREVADAAFYVWVGEVVEGQGSLRRGAFTGLAQPSTIIKWAGADNWAAVLWSRRRDIAERSAGRCTHELEVPLWCAGRGLFKWEWMRLGDWPAADHGCADCQKETIQQAYPDLVPRLVVPGDAARASSRWVCWRLCDVVGHPAIEGPADRVARTELYCGRCRARARVYADHGPGDVLKPRGRAAVSSVEKAVFEILGVELSHLGVRPGWRVVLPPDADYYDMTSLTPDCLLVTAKIAVELDGGDGQSDMYSRHDTVEGAADDAHRDRLLARVGWQVIRVRHPRALRLKDSPARVVTSSSHSPVVLAGALVEVVRSTHTR